MKELPKNLAVQVEEGFHDTPRGSIDIRAIAAAAIENAFSMCRPDEIKTDRHYKQRRATDRREGVAWFMRRNCEDLPFTFEWCCSVCGFDAEVLSKALLAEIAKGIKKTYRYNSLRRPANHRRRRG